ncbi:hypothetical protein [Pelagicoccus sp. SDUM812003]|uniref:hypothetical protein n=1 Tax=Pelagicoccus sp. SDUM812003 TaxID=3041267 RepID=UPI00280D47F5|nr:hypothetical protein [Pelagicoccus sp. SDUM812003]MDQ8204246.1 hypothetical protein [Pelagicoccus sp. SDUM812003]
MKVRSILENKNLRILGNVLTVLGIIFIAYALYQKSSEFDALYLSIRVVLSIFFGSILWILFNVFLGLGWSSLLIVFGEKIDPRFAQKICLKTQIAKYVPGNVFQFVGRALEYKLVYGGVSAAVRSILAESIILVFLAASVAVLFFVSTSYFLSYLVAPVLITMMVLSVIAWAVFRAGKYRILFKVHYSKYGVLKSVSCYYMIFILQTTILYVILVGMKVPIQMDLYELHSVLTISWVVGYVVVGSPGGLGVRETVFAMLVQNESDSVELVIAIVFLRIAAAIGDLWSYLLSLFIKAPIVPHLMRRGVDAG